MHQRSVKARVYRAKRAHRSARDNSKRQKGEGEGEGKGLEGSRKVQVWFQEGKKETRRGNKE